MAFSSGIFIDGNPMVLGSGLCDFRLTSDNRKVKTIYWKQPDLSSTSSLTFYKATTSGQIYFDLKAEVSGQSQTIKVDMWMDNLCVGTVPSGSVYIYFH